MPHNMRYRRLVPLGLSCALAVSGTLRAAENSGGEPYSYHEPRILGTSLDLQVVAPTQADADRAHAAVLDEIERLRSILSTYDDTSDLGKVNASRQPVNVAPVVIDLLKQYDQWQKASGNAFSGRIGGLVDLWKEAARTGVMPTKEEVAAAAAEVGRPLWVIDEQRGTVQRLGDATINIDSLGKGFVVTRAASHALLAAPAVKGILLNVGGDIVALGSSSATKDATWKVGITDPAHSADNAMPLVTLKLANMSVATSGSYERTFDIDGRKLSHLIDPRTGYPIDSPDAPGGLRDPLVASATVIARDNGVANALASSLCVLSPNEGLKLIAGTPGAEALIVLSSGRQMRSSGFSRYETFSNIAGSTGGNAWPNRAAVSFALQYDVFGRDRPYIAIWIEDAQGRYVTTLAQWGNGRWMNSLSTWTRIAWQQPGLVNAVSRATRPAGRYSFVWDGKDQHGDAVPPGTYKINIEMAVDHNGHSLSSGTIVCGSDPSTGTIEASRHHDTIEMSFGPQG